MTTSIEQEPGIDVTDDGRLTIRATAKCPKTGKIRERKTTLPQGGTLAEAIRWRDAKKEEIRSGALAPTRNESPENVREYSERWIARKVAADELSPNSERRYRDALTWCNVLLGDVLLEQLHRTDVLDWVEWVQELEKPNGDVYATSTLRGWWSVMRTMLKDAHADGWIPDDPTYRVRSPKTARRKTREQRTLSAAEVSALLDAARARDVRYAEIATLLYTGMRPGELYGLGWDDINWSEGIIHIRHAISAGERRDTTKTEVPRDHVLHDVVREALLEHRGGVDRIGLVFPSNAGTPRWPQSLYGELDECANVVGIEQTVRPQVIRRTWNTLQESLGTSYVVLQSMIGHSSDAMTELYAGVRHEQKVEAMARFSQLLEGSHADRS